jgi:DNA-binding PadR family transcriptional regulator
MTDSSLPRSPLWLVVLALICEEPMHPYRMATLIRQRGKDLIANVAQRNSVNQTIEALKRAGLVAVLETKRDLRRPAHTSYEATAAGREMLRTWSRNSLTMVAREFPLFPAGLSTLDPALTPAELASLLEKRQSTLQARAVELARPVPGIPRIFLIESEYMLAMARAEIKWLQAIIADLSTGHLRFPTVEEIMRIGVDKGAPSDVAIEALFGAGKAGRNQESRAAARPRPGKTASREGAATNTKRVGGRRRGTRNRNKNS